MTEVNYEDFIKNISEESGIPSIIVRQIIPINKIINSPIDNVVLANETENHIDLFHVFHVSQKINVFLKDNNISEIKFI